MPAISQLADPSIYGSQQAPKGTSLQEMIDLSRSNVAFQREKALAPFQVQQGQAQAQTAVTQSNTAQLDNALKHIGSIVQNQQTLLTKPDLTSDDIVNATKEQAARMGTPESAVNQALANIPVNGSPTELRSYLAMNLTKTLGAQSQLEKLYPGGVLPAQLPEGGYQVNKPTSEVGAAPMGGAEQPRGVTPSDMGQPPKAEYSKPVPLSYPIRQAGQAFTALPSEEEDRKVGSASRSTLVARQSELPMARRSVDEVIKKAQELEEGATLPTAGFLGSAARNINIAAGTERGIAFKELSKDLANAQIANIKASGGSMDTVAGQQLIRVANGDETYPPKVLIEIARRTQSDMTNLDMKANAIQKFSSKFGDQNLKSFEQMWSKNADPKIFQVMNIVSDPNMSPQEKASARDKLLGKDEKVLKQFNDKYMNVKKLEQTGSL
jgi:hypothetical protein